MTKKLIGLLAVLVMVAAACGDTAEETTTTAGDEEPTEVTETTAAPEEPTEGTDAAQAATGGTLQAVLDRGTLNCGFNGTAPGFGLTEADGSVSGFDADFCRYVAAAVLGDANAVEFTPLTAAERFEALDGGEIDVLSRNTTWTQSRDGDLSFDFAPTTFYDGQQVMAREADGFGAESQIPDLEGAVVCTNAGTTTEKNITELTATLGVNITLNTFEDFNQVMDQFLAGACDAVTTDGSGLAAQKATREPDGETWVIFPSSPISKEPLGPLVRENDSEWFDVVKWSVFTMIIFDEKGVTSANAADMAANSEDGEVIRLLGGEGELQTAMGLPADAWLQAVSQMGNYAEIFDTNLNPIGFVREGSLNDSFLNGGLIYAPPAR